MTPIYILIAEDDPLFREMCVLMLQRERAYWHLRETANGWAAYAHYQQEGADLILANDVLPVMSGIDLVAALRANGTQTPIILFATRATTQQAVAYDPHTVVVAKPITAGRLVKIMDQVLAPA